MPSAASSSIRSRRSRTRTTAPRSAVPRPSNSFILFRQEYARLYAEPKNLQKNLSKSAGEAWRALSDEDKQYYKDLAAVEKEKHAKMYPTYRFKPQKKQVKEGTTKTIETMMWAWTYDISPPAPWPETPPLPEAGSSAHHTDADYGIPYFPGTHWPSSVPPPTEYESLQQQHFLSYNTSFNDFVEYVPFFGILLPVGPFDC